MQTPEPSAGRLDVGAALAIQEPALPGSLPILYLWLGRTTETDMSKTAADATRVSTRWLLEQSLRAAADAQMEIRTPEGFMIGQGPDTESAVRWLAFQLSLGYQLHHLQSMVISGDNVDVFIDALGGPRPEDMPTAGTGFLKRGVWWVWDGVSWIKGTRPERITG